MSIKYHSHIQLMDNNFLRVGTGGDFTIDHDGSHTSLQNSNGNLSIKNYANDSDIIFQNDDQSGGITTYFTIDGSTGYVRFEDNRRIAVGSGDDLHILHDGTDNYIKGENGDLHIRNDANDKDIILSSDDGSGGVTAYLTIDGSATTVEVAKATNFASNVTLNGDNPTLTLNDSNGRAAAIDVVGNQFRIDDVTNNAAVLIADLSANPPALSITSTTTFSRAVTVGEDDTGYDVKFFGATSGRYMEWDESADSLILVDNVQLQLGSSSDIRMLHDGTDSKIRSTTSDLHIIQEADDKDIKFLCDDGSGGTTTYFRLDGSQATHDGSATTGLITIWPDNSKIVVGGSTDGRFWHDGSNTYLQNITGDLIIQNFADDKDIILKSDDGSGGTTAYLTLDGSAKTIEIDVPLNVGEDTSGHDVIFYGAATGEKMFWDTSESQLKINHDTDDYGLGIFTVSSAQMTQPQLKVGRDENQYWGVYTADRIAHIIHRQDESSGTMSTYFEQWDSNTSDALGQWVWRYGDGSGSSMAEALTLTQAGDLTLVGDIIHSGDTNTKIGFSAADTFQVQTGGSARFTVGNSSTTLLTTLTVGVDDTGHDVIFYGATSGAYLQWDESGDALELKDSTYLYLGTGNDLQLYHNATDSHIANYTGELYITQHADDKDIIFRSDDGSGGFTAYITLDGSATQTLVHKAMTFDDNVEARFGSGGDLHLYHNGTNSFIKNYTGDLYILNDLDDKNIYLQSDDGSGGVATYMYLDGVNTFLKIDQNTRVIDSKYFAVGTGNDLRLTHDATHSYITNYTGNLYIDQATDDGDLILQCDDGSGGLTPYITLDGSAARTVFSQHTEHADTKKAFFGNSLDFALYHNATDSVIENATGDLYIVNGADDKDIIFQSDDGSGGLTTYFKLDGSVNSTMFPDSSKLYFGSGHDAYIEHDGTNTYLSNATGKLIIRNTLNDGDIELVCDDGSGGNTAYLTLDGSATRTIANQHLQMADGKALYVGASSDAGFYHLSGQNYIENNTGDLTIVQNTDDGDIIFHSDNGSGGTSQYMRIDGGVQRVVFSVDVKLQDNDILRVGSGNDLQIQHDGSNSYITQLGTGDLYIQNTTDDADIHLVSDDGSGGTTAYITLDGTNVRTLVNQHLNIIDDIILQIGSSQDLKIYHDENNSYISQEGTGDLYIRNTTDDKDIIFQSDDGSGGVETYFFLDGSASSGNPVTIFPDSSGLYFGTGADCMLRHDGTDMTFENNAGDLVISCATNDKDVIIKSDDGSGGTTAYITLDGSVTRTIFSQEARFTDSVNLKFGTGGDMMLYHDGSNSYIDHTGTGDLYIRQGQDDKDIIFQSDDGSGGLTTYLTLDSSDPSLVVSKKMLLGDNVSFYVGSNVDLELNHDGSDSFITARNTDLKIQQLGDDKDIVFICDDGSGGTADYFRLDGALGYTTVQKDIRFNDSVDIKLGTGNDCTIMHDGTDTWIDNATGDLKIRNQTDDGNISFYSDNGSGGIAEYLRIWGQYEIVQALKTMKVGDNVKFVAGDGEDLQLYHDGSNSYIQQSGTGDLYIQNGNDDKDIILRSDDGSGGQTAYITLDGSATQVKIDKETIFADSVKSMFGAGGDLQIYHDGSNSYLDNITGNLTIRNFTDDGDIIFQSDDHSGGVSTYFFLDGSTTSELTTSFPDNSMAAFGTGKDLRLWHDGSTSYINNYTGDFRLYQHVDDGDMKFYCDDGSGGATPYITLDGGNTDIDFHKNTHHLDSVLVKVGSASGGDLQIYHNGSHSLISNQTGDLFIRNQTDDGDIKFQADDGSGGDETYITIDGGATKTILNKPSQRTFEVSDASTHGDANGDIVYFGGTTSMSAGKIYHYKANGTWELADADAASTSDGLLAVAIGAASDTNGMLVRGMVTLDHDPGDLGDVLFLSTTAGEATGTAPSSSGDIVRVVGYLLGGAHGQIYFNPDGAFVEVA